MANTAEDTSNLLSAQEKPPNAAPTLGISLNLHPPPHQDSNEELKQVVSLLKEMSQGNFMGVFYSIRNGKLPANLIIDNAHKWYLAHYLVMNNKPRELEILVSKFDCDINITDAYRQTPLHMATLHNRLSIFLYLVHHPMIAFDTRDYIHSSPLLNAVKSGFLEAFIYLYFERGCDIKATDIQGFTVVHWAAYKKITPLLQLFQHIPEVDMNATDTEGTTPIFKAVQSISFNSAKYLISVANADLDAKSNRGQTPLEMAESMPMHPRLLAYVKKHTGLQKVKKQGVFGYLNTTGLAKGYSSVLCYLLRTYGRTMNIVVNVMIMLLIAVTSVQMNFMSGTFSGLCVLHYVLIIPLFETLLAKHDPGYIPQKTLDHPNNAVSRIVEAVRGGVQEDCSGYCFTCLVKPPQGSHHCLNCNRCVSKFQFHLSACGLNLCVGEKNFRFYFLYLFFELALFFLYSVCVLSLAMETARTPFPVNLLERWLKLFDSFKIAAILILVFIYRSAGICHELLVMLTATWKGVTVHEMRNPHSCPYLFDVRRSPESSPQYVHRPLTWGDCCCNLGRFCASVLKIFGGAFGREESAGENEEYVQLPEINRASEEAKETH